jgi:hypothetical protein
VAFTVAVMLLGSTAFLLHKTNRFPDRPLLQTVAGGTGLIVLSVAMFLTARLWAKWFVGAILGSILRVGFLLLTLPAPSFTTLTAPRLSALKVFFTLMGLAALSIRCLIRDPRRLEAVGLAGAVVSISFGLVLDSFVPSLIGLGWLGLAQLVNWVGLQRLKRISRDYNHVAIAGADGEMSKRSLVTDIRHQ